MCATEALEFVPSLVGSTLRIVVDAQFEILGEYWSNVVPQDPGYAAITELIASDRVDYQQIEIRLGVVVLAAKLDGLVYDMADRKFVAVAVAHPKRPPILNASDTDWLDWQEGLKRDGIEVRHVCEDELASRRASKSSPS